MLFLSVSNTHTFGRPQAAHPNSNLSNMTSDSTDAWKDLASRMKSSPSKAGPTVQHMISRMDQLWPFPTAKGLFDNGCGGGSIISYILDEYGAQLPDSAAIIAGDFSQSMLDVMRARKEAQIEAGDNIAWTKLQIRKLDAHNLKGMEEESVSHVTGGHVYFLLDDPRQALRETCRVLCPGGLVGLTSGKTSQHVGALCDAVESVKPGTNLQLFKAPWSTEEGVEGELRASGFEVMETYLVGSTISYTSVEEFAAVLLTMPVMKDTLATLSEDERGQLNIKLVENLREQDSEQRGLLSGVNIVAIGRKSL